eukprot:m51a1_g6030 hypothetical protein (99) ;mRNA; r:119357-119653
MCGTCLAGPRAAAFRSAAIRCLRAHFRKERGVLACCNAAGMVISGLALPAVLFCLLFWPEDNHGCSEVVMFLGTANKANSANIALALLFTQKKTTGSL